MIKFEVVRGIGRMVNPKIIDLSVNNIVEVEAEGFKVLEVDGVNYEFNNNIAKFKAVKGTHSLRLIKYGEDGKGLETIPCEPILIFDVNDHQAMKVALYVDDNNILDRVRNLEVLTDAQGIKISKLAENLEKVTNKFNEVIPVINDLSVRVSDLEKDYDPTQIKN